MSLRDRQIREILDADLNAYREAYVRQLKQARLLNESYTPPNRFERQVAFQISKYFIEFQRAIDDVINSNQPEQEPITNGSALIKIYSELVPYIDSYQSSNPLNQRDVATIEEKFDALIPSLSQVVNLAQEQAWRDSGVLEELFSMIEDRVYLPLKEALTRLPSHKKMLVDRLGFTVAEDRLRAKQQEALERNQAIARGADLRQAFREEAPPPPPEYVQGDFPYVPPEVATPKRKGGPKALSFYKRFREEIEFQAKKNGTEDLLGDRTALATMKVLELRKLLSAVTGLKQKTPEYKALLTDIEEGKSTLAGPVELDKPEEEGVLGEGRQGFGLPAVMRRQKSPTENIVLHIKEGGTNNKKLRAKKRREKLLLKRPAPVASESDTETESESESEGEDAVDAYYNNQNQPPPPPPRRHRIQGGTSRFAVRRDQGEELTGGFGETEGQMSGLPRGMRFALALRPIDRRPAPKHYESIGTPEEYLTMEQRMYFLNQLDSHQVRDEDDVKDFNSITNLRKMMEKRLKKHK